MLKRAAELAAEAARIRLSSWRHCGMRRGVSETSPKILRSRPRYVIDGDYAYRTGGIQALPGERVKREQVLPWLRRGVEVGGGSWKPQAGVVSERQERRWLTW